MRTMMKDFIESERKGSTVSHVLEHPPPIGSKSRQSLGKEVANNIFFGLTARPATATDDPNDAIWVRRWLSNGKHKQSDHDIKDVGGEDKEYSKGTCKMGNWAVEYSNLPQHLETNCKVYEEETNSKPTELHHSFDVTESMIKELRCEVSILKTKLEKLQKRNIELELHNKWLIENFSSGNAKIFNLEKHDQVALHVDTKHLEFRVMQRIMEDRLCSFCLRKVGNKEAKKPSRLLPGSESRQVQSKNSMSQSFPLTIDHPVKNGGFPPPPPHPSIQYCVSNGPPPPPPPPGLHQVPYKAKTIQKPVAVVELYNSLRKEMENRPFWG
ncbi:hypothetical protein HPP92_012767 [Vanilla planifolia]|uniref:Uncharacterized protein n=1 Tax=Vanilla planifolia TaxID=51239 RepID=A0A835QM64_VANPL|nr:hypothetical protein HPP92_012767 [Vanilla planifolia]